MNVNKAGQTHDQLQAACWKEAVNSYYGKLYQYIFSINNTGSRGNAKVAKQFQALGVTPGVWDVEFINPLNGTVNWIELKVGSDKVSPDQHDFFDKMKRIGHRFFIASEVKEFLNIIDCIVKNWICQYEVKELKLINKRVEVKFYD